MRVLVDGQTLGSGAVLVPVSNSPVSIVVGTAYLTAGQHGLIVEGQYTSNGDYGDNSCNFASVTLTPINSETYARWVDQYFTPAQQASTAISGPNGVPQSDGVPNLLKYLFDIDPARPMSFSDRSALPVVGMVNINNTRYLTLTYRQFTLATGVSSRVQTSSDLVNWTIAPDATVTQTGTDPDTADPVIQVRVVSAEPRQFIRLQVTEP